MTLLQSIVLGAVQGLTEFLPISSSAHLILVPRALGWTDPGLAFDVFLHLGTLLATLIYFVADWLRLTQAGVKSIIERRIGFDRDRQLFWAIVIGTIPAGVAGLLFHDYIETIFRDPILMAIPLSMIGFLMYWVDLNYPSLRPIDDLGVKDSVWIGMGQALALVPGVSRSGATLTVARLRGFDRASAARFSFLLSLPITLAAFLFEWRKLAEASGENGISREVLVGGLISSTLVGMCAIHFLLYFLRNSSLKVFAWYRVALAAVIIAWSLM